MSNTMKLTLNEALTKAQTWREKMERLGLVKMPEVVHKPTEAIPVEIKPVRSKWLKEYGIKKSAKLSAERLNFRKRYYQRTLKALEKDAWNRVADVAVAIKVNVQRCMSIAEDLEKEGKVKTSRYHDSTWIALAKNAETPLPEDKEFFVRRLERRRENKRKHREREKAALAISPDKRAKTTRFIRSLPGGVKWDGEAAEVASAPSEGWRTPQ